MDLSEFSRWKFWFCQHFYVVSCGCCWKLWVCQKHMLSILKLWILSALSYWKLWFCQQRCWKLWMLSTLSWRKLWAKVQPIDKLVRNCTSICTYLISSDFDRHVQLYLRYSQFLSFPCLLHKSVTSEILKSRVLDSFPHMAQNNCALLIRGAHL